MNIQLRIIFVISLLIIFGSLGITSATPVPDTGQTVQFTFFGEDSDYTINPHSYTKLDFNGNALPSSAASWAMVRDNVTGLIWEVKTDDGGIHDWDNTYNANDAQNVFIKALNDNSFGGFNDWRIPTAKELVFLVDRDRGNPAINISYFPNTQSSNYLASDSSGWCVYFWNGSASNYFKPPAGYYVRAVHGIQTTNHFVDNGDGTVTDTDTGLMWQQVIASPYYPQWMNAITYCENLVLAGYDDWRLPNINELFSIARVGSTPAIDQDYFPGTKWNEWDQYYWSSTINVLTNFPIYAWNVDFADGEINSSDSEIAFLHVRAVRGGNSVTLIELSSFNATPKAGKVILSWTTESETDNAGFKILRSNSADGEYTQINNTLIPAQGSSTEGASYQFIDSAAQNRQTYFYKLEDIDLNGKSTMHGPVNATPRLIYGIGK
jgi:hypothetical protein